MHLSVSLSVCRCVCWFDCYVLVLFSVRPSVYLSACVGSQFSRMGSRPAPVKDVSRLAAVLGLPFVEDKSFTCGSDGNGTEVIRRQRGGVKALGAMQMMPVGEKWMSGLT